MSETENKQKLEQMKSVCFDRTNRQPFRKRKIASDKKEGDTNKQHRN